MSEKQWKRAEACSNSLEARFRVVLPCSGWHVLSPDMSNRVTLFIILKRKITRTLGTFLALVVVR